MATTPDPDEVLRSTRGKENFQRISRLLISGGTTLLREIFDQILPPSNLPTVLKNPATRIRLQAVKLTKPQWDCLYPSPGVYGKSTEFDVTLLFKLLMTICNLIPPATGWCALPTSTDHSLAADVVRIKCYRHSVFGHVNQEITDDQFALLCQDISEVLVRIAGQISPTKKSQWKVAIFNFLRNPLAAEDERNVPELPEWYRNDTKVKESIEELKATIEKLRGLETTVREEAQDIKDQLGEMHQSIDRLSSSAGASQATGDAVKEGLPKNDDLERLAYKIINEWKTLGRRLLESDEALLDAIDKDNDKSSEKAYKMLLKWKAVKGSDATFRVLHDALCHHLVDRRDLAEEFCLVTDD